MVHRLQILSVFTCTVIAVGLSGCGATGPSVASPSNSAAPSDETTVATTTTTPPPTIPQITTIIAPPTTTKPVTKPLQFKTADGFTLAISTDGIVKKTVRCFMVPAPGRTCLAVDIMVTNVQTDRPVYWYLPMSYVYAPGSAKIQGQNTVDDPSSKFNGYSIYRAAIASAGSLSGKVQLGGGQSMVLTAYIPDVDENIDTSIFKFAVKSEPDIPPLLEIPVV